MNILVRRKHLSDTEEITNPIQGNQSSPLWATIEEPPEWGGHSHFKTGGSVVKTFTAIPRVSIHRAHALTCHGFHQSLGC